MSSVKELIAQIEEAAEKASTEIRNIENMKVGEWVRQGDLKIERVEPFDTDGLAAVGGQLAPGTSMGSRHVAGSPAKAYRLDKPGVLEGPLVVSKKRWVLEHPEHAHVSFPAGSFKVTYQRDVATEDRVRD